MAGAEKIAKLVKYGSPRIIKASRGGVVCVENRNPCGQVILKFVQRMKKRPTENKFRWSFFHPLEIKALGFFLYLILWTHTFSPVADGRQPRLS
ncbi:MAG: hypothetical protein ACREOO_31525 [bacterium]